MTLLTLTGLSVGYGAVEALHGVDLDVAAGTVTGVLGANGAGKTSLLMGIMGATPRRSGSIRFDGVELGHAPTGRIVEAGIALCPQNRRLFPSMSIEDNLLLGATLAPAKVARERLEAAYQRTPWFAERRRESAGRLSGGQQQLVAIARALMSEPRLLMLDEPSSGLSPVAVQEVRALLERVAAAGLTVLLVEQNTHLVQHLCSSVYVLADGRVVGHDTVQGLVENDLLSDAYLGG
ncbi:ABC transporter ATP-binding protein [Microbacterium hydrocarbonoxydans]|uniref:ABC transporter ATP-binding protein n=1 Tax=Microbacterium hydrocarbonoxydans TaxID=273678 RepID=UPI0007BB41AC|nr:ABC transporter ATP-binding protein [Microbacterium hydrocarbonoxydans]GAT74344.1 ABC-type branched-chain amino acid transport system, ATPase component [Microbacterium sp. HM58-2]